MSNDTLSTNKDKNKLLSSSKLLNLELYRNIINKNTLISIGIFLLIKLYVNYDSIILSLREPLIQTFWISSKMLSEVF